MKIIVNGFLSGTINFFTKPSILDLWLGSDYTFVEVSNKSNKIVLTQ